MVEQEIEGMKESNNKGNETERKHSSIEFQSAILNKAESYLLESRQHIFPRIFETYFKGLFKVSMIISSILYLYFIFTPNGIENIPQEFSTFITNGPILDLLKNINSIKSLMSHFIVFFCLSTFTIVTLFTFTSVPALLISTHITIRQTFKENQKLSKVKHIFQSASWKSSTLVCFMPIVFFSLSWLCNSPSPIESCLSSGNSFITCQLTCSFSFTVVATGLLVLTLYNLKSNFIIKLLCLYTCLLLIPFFTFYFSLPLVIFLTLITISFVFYLLKNDIDDLLLNALKLDLRSHEIEEKNNSKITKFEYPKLEEEFFIALYDYEKEKLREIEEHLNGIHSTAYLDRSEQINNKKPIE